MGGLVVTLGMFAVLYVVLSLVYDWMFDIPCEHQIRDDTPNFMWFHFDD